MKKLLILGLILHFGTQGFAYENYVIISQRPVKYVYSEDISVAMVKPLYTVDNQRNILILNALKEGKTKVTVNFGDKSAVIKVNVKENKTVVSSKKNFIFYKMDEPPEALDILEPPMLGGER